MCKCTQNKTEGQDASDPSRASAPDLPLPCVGPVPPLQLAHTELFLTAAFCVPGESTLPGCGMGTSQWSLHKHILVVVSGKVTEQLHSALALGCLKGHQLFVLQVRGDKLWNSLLALGGQRRKPVLQDWTALGKKGKENREEANRDLKHQEPVPKKFKQGAIDTDCSSRCCLQICLCIFSPSILSRTFLFSLTFPFT